MAKNNARQEPQKQKVTENKKMSDIAFILDKKDRIQDTV